MKENPNTKDGTKYSATQEKKIVFNTKTMEIRIYSHDASKEGLSIVCLFCEDRDRCDQEVVKPCLTPCG